MKQKKLIKILILLALFVCFVASPALAQEVIEKYRLGNIIEGLTFVREGELAGKLVFRDRSYLYSYDLDTDKYERLFCYASLCLEPARSSICSISTGVFAGNLLMNFSCDFSKLYIVSPSGSLVSEVSIVGFETFGEGLAEITSDPYNGMFALLEYPVGNIAIFRIVDEGNAVNAYLVKHIVPDPAITPLDICFLPDDFPDPQYRNHFVISGQAGSVAVLTVFDDEGNQKISFPVDCLYEGLSYIDKGLYKGKLALSCLMVPFAWIRNLDGTNEIPLNVMAGIGLVIPYKLTWLANENQLLIGSYNNDFYFLSRLAPENWEKISELVYPGIPRVHDITDLLSDGYHYLLGFNWVWDDSLGRNVRLFEVQKLDPAFNLVEIFPLYHGDFYGKEFFSLFFNPDEDKFGVIQIRDNLTGEILNNACLFDSNFNYLESIDLSEITEKAGNIGESYFDPDTQRYYILESNKLMLVFNPSWELIAECDMSQLAECGYFHCREFAKITSGELQGNFILCDSSNNDMLIVNLEPQVIISQLELLVAEIQNSDIHRGTKNTLMKLLESALKSFDKDKIGATINKIEEFQDEVQSQSGKKIPEDLAERWISRAEEIIKDLQDL